MRDVNLQTRAQLNKALQKICFLGDVHASFLDITRALLAASIKPSWHVFLGDIDHMPLSQVLEYLRKSYPGIEPHGQSKSMTSDRE